MSGYDYIVTGSSGFIGRSLLGHLAFKYRDKKILAIDKAGPPPWVPSQPNVSFINADLVDVIGKILYEERKGAVTIHLAAVPDIKACQADPIFAINQNVELLKKMLIGFSASGPFLFVSSVAASYPTNVYGMTKLAAEVICRAHGATVVRLNNVYGHGGRGAPNIFVRNALLGENIVIHSQTASNTYNFVEVDDVSATLSKIADMRCEGGRFCVTGPKDCEATSTDLAKIVIDETGSKSAVTLKPARIAVAGEPVKDDSFCNVYTKTSLRDGVRSLIVYERSKTAKAGK